MRLHTLSCHSCTVKVEVNFVACAVPHCSYMVPSINWRGCAEKKLFCDNRKLHSSLYASCENSKGATGHAIWNLKKVKTFLRINWIPKIMDQFWYLTFSVFTKSVNSNFRAFWLTPVTRNIYGYSLFCDRSQDGVSFRGIVGTRNVSDRWSIRTNKNQESDELWLVGVYW